MNDEYERGVEQGMTPSSSPETRIDVQAIKARSEGELVYSPEFVENFWARVNKTAGCWLWTGSLSSSGRARCYAGGRVRNASRVVMAIVGRPVGPDMFACHACDNPACVNPDHIFPGTPLDNMRDMVGKGRHIPCRQPGDANPSRLYPERRQRGSQQPNAKLREADVVGIRTAVAAGRPQKALAAELGVSRFTVCSIVNRRGWTHVV
jgi:hypothetical protein